MTVPHLIPAMEASTAPAAFAAVRAHGLRLSSARRLLLQALFAAERDVASTYRNLEVLEGLGLVRHVHLGHGPRLYQPAGRPRDFVVCEGCGDVSPLSPDAVDAVREAVLDAVGYRARFAHFPLAGLCPACSMEEDAC